MTSYELINELCCITEILMEVVKEQAGIIAQTDVPEETKYNLEKKIEEISSDMNTMEYSLRRII